MFVPITVLSLFVVQDLSEDLRSLRAVEEPRALVERIAATHARDEVLARLVFPLAPLEAQRAPAGWSWGEAVDEAGVSRPYQRYLPESVARGEQPVALLVHLHGAVSREDFADELGAVGYGGTMWAEQADRHGFALAFPLGRSDCKWWTEAGLSNVRAVVRDMKRRAPVDDDRIVQCGFSDGASAGWFLSMAAPDPFAAFLTMNGHPRVATGAGSRALDLRNLALSPVLAAMTQDDSLYPGWTVLRHVQEAMRHGARITVLSYPEGGHQPAYFETQREVILSFILEARRDAVPSRIRWFADRAQRVRWLEFVELGESAADAPWPEEAEVMSVPGPVRLGASVDFDFLGDGVRLREVPAASLAAELGLADGDVLRSLDGAPIDGFMALREAFGALQRDRPFELEYGRGEELRTVEGRVPPFRSRPLYRREGPRAFAEVVLGDDELRIVSAGLRRLRVHLSPGMLDHDELRVEWNGRRWTARPQERSLDEILVEAHRSADWSRVCDRELELRLDES